MRADSVAVGTSASKQASSKEEEGQRSVEATSGKTSDKLRVRASSTTCVSLYVCHDTGKPRRALVHTEYIGKVGFQGAYIRHP